MNLFKYFLFFSSVAGLSLPDSPIQRNKIKSIDNKILSYTSAATLNNFISPLVGIVDGIWIGKLGTPEMLAGSGYGDQIFGITYDLTSYVSPIITPEIAEMKTRNEIKKVKELIFNSLFLSIILGSIMSTFTYIFAERITNILISNNFDIFKYTLKYLKYRILSLPFALINSSIFGILRGMEDFKNAVWINTKAQIVNIILDPLLMYQYGFIGIVLGSIIAEIYCALEFLVFLYNKDLIDFSCKLNFRKQFEIMKKGISIQLKNMNYNFMIILMNNKIMTLPDANRILAAHVIMSRLYQLGSIFHAGLSSVSSTIIPVEKITNDDRLALNRLLRFGNIIGITQLFLILLSRPLISLFTSDKVILNECFKVIKYLSLLVYLNSLSSVFEGSLQGYKKYNTQTLISFLSFSTIFISLYFCKNLSHIWISILTMALVRLVSSSTIILYNK